MGVCPLCGDCARCSFLPLLLLNLTPARPSPGLTHAPNLFSHSYAQPLGPFIPALLGLDKQGTLQAYVSVSLPRTRPRSHQQLGQ